MAALAPPRCSSGQACTEVRLVDADDLAVRDVAEVPVLIGTIDPALEPTVTMAVNSDQFLRRDMADPPQRALLEAIAGADAIASEIHLDDLPLLAPVGLPGDGEQLALGGIAVGRVDDDELTSADVGRVLSSGTSKAMQPSGRSL